MQSRSKVLAELSSDSSFYPQLSSAFEKNGVSVDFVVSKTNEERLNAIQPYSVLATHGLPNDLLENAENLRLI